MMGSVSEAAARDDSVEVGDEDIGRVRVTGTFAKWIQMKGRIVARGGKGIYQRSVLEPSFSFWVL